MSKRVISPGGVVDGVVELPGDKSISHRYAIIAALAEGRSEIGNYASSADCQSTLECLRRLGVDDRKERSHRAHHGRGAERMEGAAQAARRGKFRLDDADDGGRAGGAAVYVHADGRRITATPADAACDRAAAANGRGNSEQGRRPRAARDSRRAAARDRLRAADSERAGEIGGAACGALRRRANDGA